MTDDATTAAAENPHVTPHEIEFTSALDYVAECGKQISETILWSTPFQFLPEDQGAEFIGLVYDGVQDIYKQTMAQIMVNAENQGSSDEDVEQAVLHLLSGMVMAAVVHCRTTTANIALTDGDSGIRLSPHLPTATPDQIVRARAVLDEQTRLMEEHAKTCPHHHAGGHQSSADDLRGTGLYL